MRVPADGTYQIRTDGQVGGFISPRLAFGHGSPYGWLPWMFAGWFAIGLVGLMWSVLSTMRSRRAPQAVVAHEMSVTVPDEEAIKLEQLKTLTALRDSGALTAKEFDDEKRRILDGR